MQINKQQYRKAMQIDTQCLVYVIIQDKGNTFLKCVVIGQVKV